MRETQEVQLHIMDYEEKETNSELARTNSDADQHPTELQRRNFKWWLRVAFYATFVLAGQTTATLLTRLYFDEGGQSKWMGTLVQTVGFPMLIPIYFFYPSKNQTPNGNHIDPKKASKLVLVPVYVTLGLVVSGVCYISSVGLMYLSVSTYTLISVSQLGFAAVFSFFINSQKFTPYILNSLVLLAVSSVLLVFHSDDSSGSDRVSKTKYAIGCLCAIGVSAGYGLLLSLTQCIFQKVIKFITVRAVLEMVITETLVASCVAVVGLFASGERKGLSREMEEFGLGKVSYVMTLVWCTISCQFYSIGNVGLIFEVSSLFCNIIIAMTLPLAQVLAVLIFHDKMDGLKAISLVLAIWGFVSYLYQHYLDDYSDSKSYVKEEPSEGVSKTSPLGEDNE